MTTKTKIAIIQSHPIQHFCPQFASYTEIHDVEVKVFFETDKGLKTYYDNNFKQQITWTGVDITKFQHQFIFKTKISDALNDYNPDIMIIYGYTQTIQKEAWQYATKKRKTILYISDSENHQKRSPLKELIKRIWLKQYFSRINYCLSVGDSNEEVYRSYGIDNSRIIRMFFPINVDYFNSLLTQKTQISLEIRNKYLISDDTIVISTIGKLVPWKRQIDIIYVLRQLEKRNIKATAFIIGSGPDEENLKKENEQNNHNKAIITGFVQPELMAQYLCATNIYVHPAEKEPHSLAISEAIYCGCPAIISDRCGSYGPTDDIQPGRNGFVYPLGNISSLADRIEFFQKQPLILKEFSMASTSISRKNQNLAHGEALKSVLNLIKVQ